MIFKYHYFNLSIVFLTISTVYSHKDYFYKVSLHDDIFSKTDITPLSNTRAKRFASAEETQPPTKTEYHTYYNSTTIHDDEVFNQYWVNLTSHSDDNIYIMSTDPQVTSVTLKLKFPFLFYGHLINSTTIATGGFLYLGDYIHSSHSWLAATQYIAPLMANFNFNASNNSNIYYMNNDTAFAVTWHNVTLQNKPEVGRFTFQTILYPNGNIAFVYENLPMKIKEIDPTNHSVKIGLSDAYAMDEEIHFRPKTNKYEYHNVTLLENEIYNHTVIILTALPTCPERKNYTSCIKKDNNLQCYWCDDRCTSGIDRNSQNWNEKDCEKLKLNPEDIGKSEIPNHTPIKVDNSSTETIIKSESHTNSSSNTSLLFIGLCVSLLFISLAWTLYAYLNPHTRSGQLLLRYTPNRWCRRNDEDRYTAATINFENNESTNLRKYYHC